VRWVLIKDVLLTGTGMVLMWSQIFSTDPRWPILAAGLALTSPSVADHVKALLPGPGGGLSSPPSPSPPSPPPGLPRGATHD
jgi:hypothetical protein